MFWIAFAAATSALSAPVPLNQRQWFVADDVPRSVMYITGSHRWTVGISIKVAPDGTIQSCAVEVGSQVPDLDRLSCELVKTRARFSAARWSDGKPAYGVFRTAIVWAVTDDPSTMPPKSPLPDLELAVQSMPSGVKSPSLVRVMFAVDTNGKIVECAPETRALEPTENAAALIPVACEEFAATFKLGVPTDPAGNPVPSIQDGLVRFVLDKH
jgi:hypothetical protein